MAPFKVAYKLHKNPDFTAKKGKKASRGRSNRPPTTATYIGANGEEVRTRLAYDLLEENASKLIKEKFCDVTGYETSYTHHKNFLNYLDRFVYKYLKHLPKNSKEEFRALRGVKKGF